LMLSLSMSIRCLALSLSQNRLRTFGADGLSNLGRLDGRTQISKKDLYVLDLPAAERSSSCVPRRSAIQGTVPLGPVPGMPGLRAMQANPFIHNVNQQDASSLQSGETGF
jgi:hypothetical protein